MFSLSLPSTNTTAKLSYTTHTKRSMAHSITRCLEESTELLRVESHFLSTRTAGNRFMVNLARLARQEDPSATPVSLAYIIQMTVFATANELRGKHYVPKTQPCPNLIVLLINMRFLLKTNPHVNLPFIVTWTCPNEFPKHTFRSFWVELSQFTISPHTPAGGGPASPFLFGGDMQDALEIVTAREYRKYHLTMYLTSIRDQFPVRQPYFGSVRPRGHGPGTPAYSAAAAYGICISSGQMDCPVWLTNRISSRLSIRLITRLLSSRNLCTCNVVFSRKVPNLDMHKCLLLNSTWNQVQNTQLREQYHAMYDHVHHPSRLLSPWRKCKIKVWLKDLANEIFSSHMSVIEVHRLTWVTDMFGIMQCLVFRSAQSVRFSNAEA